MDCPVCGERMFTWKEEVWGRIEIWSECDNPKCGEEESSDEESED